MTSRVRAMSSPSPNRYALSSDRGTSTSHPIGRDDSQRRLGHPGEEGTPCHYEQEHFALVTQEPGVSIRAKCARTNTRRLRYPWPLGERTVGGDDGTDETYPGRGRVPSRYD